MGVVNEEEVEVIRALNGAEGPVSSLLFQGFKTYESVKGKALESKRIGSTVGSAVGFFEGTVSKATKLSPVKVERVVGVLDSSVDSALKYGKETTETVKSTVEKVGSRPAQLKNSACTTIHTQLEKFIDVEEKEEEEEPLNPEDIGFKVLMDDVSTMTSQRANKLLDVSEVYVDKYLHDDEESKEDEEDNGEGKEVTDGAGVATRVFVLSKVVSKRMQKRAYAGLDHLKLRTQEVTHIDLVKYSNMLDTRKAQAYDIFESRIAVPARKVKEDVEVKASAAKEYVGGKATEAKEVADKYQQIARERIVAIKVPYTDKDVGFYIAVVSDAADKRIVKPIEEIVETFKKDLEVQKKTNDKPLTIEAGFRALIAAVRQRARIMFSSDAAEGSEQDSDVADVEAEEGAYHDAEE